MQLKKDKNEQYIKKLSLKNEVFNYYQQGCSVEETWFNLDKALSKEEISNFYKEFSSINTDREPPALTILNEVRFDTVKTFNEKLLKVKDLSITGILKYLYYNQNKLVNSAAYVNICKLGLSLVKEFNLEDISLSKNEPNLTKLYVELLPIFKEILDTECEFSLIKGGRGSGKSIGLADIIIACSFLKKYSNTDFLCFRQYQISMQASMHSLLNYRINYFGLTNYFKINKTDIKNTFNNVDIYFKGMVDPHTIKSITNISLGVADEAQQMNTEPIEQVLPSVRRIDGKPMKVVLAMNPSKPVDPALAYITRQGSNALIKHFNIFDLPKKYQNKSLLRQAEIDRNNNIELFNHKWLGLPSPVYAGTPFSTLLRTSDFNDNEPTFSQMYIDPAFSGVNDYTAITIIWPGKMGTNFYNYIMVYGVILKLNYKDAAPDVANLIVKFNVKDIKYEANGGAHPMNQDIAIELDKLNYKDYYLESVINKDNKVLRINKLIGVIDRFMFIEDIKSKDYIEQILNYNPNYSAKHNKEGYFDDAPDSLAGASKYYLGL